MAPHSEVENEEDIVRLPAPEKPQMSESPPRLIIIGAGSRGNAYARALGEATNGICAAVVEPIPYKRQALGRAYIWGDGGQPADGQEFEDWKDFVAWEEARRVKYAAGEDVPEGVDGAFICVQDELHKSVILGLEKLNIHIMCEKPLATTLKDCIDIYRSLLPSGASKPPRQLFSVGHVLRYSPHNMLLRKLLLEDKVIGDILSVMLARGALIKPWLFEEIQAGQYIDKSSTERLAYIEKFARYGLDAWGSDEMGVGQTRRFLLEWLSFAHRYVPVGILEHLPPSLQDRPPAYRSRDDLEGLLASPNYKDWIKISEMFLGPAHKDFQFQPKHKSNSYDGIEAEG